MEDSDEESSGDSDENNVVGSSEKWDRQDDGKIIQERKMIDGERKCMISTCT